ncbi:hypothetical protein [Sphingobacterium faecium]|uniref:hypothetical protein n=1 Tax=Sphingobacterium faecium TaxID=34087 RepID=UPI002468556A|nr:hypothetical protein [Sphingobacterium faecium]MDH5827956.1 hypothetical protein [Sphingobacterium faecium]
MNQSKISALLTAVVVLLLSSCASKFHSITPEQLYYKSDQSDKEVILGYNYDLLSGKYKKKETKKNIKIVSLKIQNESDRDLIFGQNLHLCYANGSEVDILNIDQAFNALKQKPATYLWYLPLSILQLNITKTENGYTTDKTSIPVGLAIGPGIAFGNLAVASAANKKFRTNLVENNLIGRTIKKGETVFGLVGIMSSNYEGLQLKTNTRK